MTSLFWVTFSLLESYNMAKMNQDELLWPSFPGTLFWCKKDRPTHCFILSPGPVAILWGYIYIFFHKMLFGSKLQRIQQWLSIIFIISSTIRQHIKKSKGVSLDHLSTGIKFQSYSRLLERETDLVKFWSQFCFGLFCFISVFYHWFPKSQTALLPLRKGKNQIKIV